MLKATIDDLARQLEQLQSKYKPHPLANVTSWSHAHCAGMLKAKEEEVGSLRGEKAGLEREVDRLARENRGLREEVAALRDELARQAAGMEQAE